MKKSAILFALLCYIHNYSQQIMLEEFASGFTSPVEIVNANDNRLFVVQQNGIIKILQPNGTVNSSDFLNISTKIINNGEMGLLGLAFHPQYSSNGYFYIFYNNTSGNIVVARYSVNSGNPDLADSSSEQILLNIPKPNTNHNGGSIHFGPDNYLWISTGDGGGGGDPNNNAQNKNSLLGKILRIDVNSGSPYAIPATNPFANTDGADEIWSYGIRNAWKFSFDSVDENVWIADVGQENFEEINKMPSSQSGINYGWRCYEGNAGYITEGCSAASTMTFPVAVYNHDSERCSITGGYVYRGTNFPDLQGKYIFTDYCIPQIGVLNSENQIVWSSLYAGNNFSTFGEDLQKELYVAAINNGKIYKVKTNFLGTGESSTKQYKIYPNPASDNIFISGIDGNISVEIYSSEGKKTEITKLSQNGSADISSLVPGIYFINVKQNGQKVFSQKLIKK